MTSLPLDDQLVASLALRAVQEGVTVDALLRRWLSAAPRREYASSVTADELERMLDEESSDSAGLPDDFSRADIYGDHA